jgi:hypothetical protein
MKALQIGHASLTGLLLFGTLVFAVLLWFRVLEVRTRSKPDASTPESGRPGEARGYVARLLVVRGLRPNWEYRIFEGRNVLGRADEKPVDIDLQPLEPEERIWSSRQHAVITCDGSSLWIEDLNTTNGTYVNESRVHPGERRPLRDGDVIQIGEVQLKVLR